MNQLQYKKNLQEYSFIKAQVYRWCKQNQQKYGDRTPPHPPHFAFHSCQVIDKNCSVTQDKSEKLLQVLNLEQLLWD